jgi:hypothetical protein
MSTVQLPILSALIFAVPLSIQAQDRVATEKLRTKLEAKGSVAQFERERQEFIKQLIAIVVKKPTKPEMTAKGINAYEQEQMVRRHAVNVLGDIRAIEATQILVEHITQVVPSATNGNIFGDDAPYLPALVKIGKPGAKAALKELRKPMKIPRRLLLLMVIRQVEGRRAGELLFKNEIATANGSGERKNLEDAFAEFLKRSPLRQ